MFKCSTTIKRHPAPPFHIRKNRPTLLLLAPSRNFTSFSETKLLPAIRTIPFSSTWWNLRQTHAFQMKPLLFALHIVSKYNRSNIKPPREFQTHFVILTTNHYTEAYTVAEAVSWLIGINQVALVIKFFINLWCSTFFDTIFLLVFSSCLLACC